MKWLKEFWEKWYGKLVAALAAYEVAGKLWHIGQLLTASGLTWLVWAQAQMADVPTFVVTAACIAVFTLVLGGWRFLVPLKTTTTVLQFGSASNDAAAIRLFADQLPRATPKELEAPLVKGRRLYLYDVPRVNGVIQGRNFEDCVVEGPAIVTSAGPNHFVSTQIDTPSADATFIGLHAEDNTPMVGVIGLAFCRFLRCKVVDIAFMGPPEAMEANKQALIASSREWEEGRRPPGGPRPH